MSTQVRISDTTYKNLKDYCSQGEKPSMLAVIDVAVERYLEGKNGKDVPSKEELERAVEFTLDLADPPLSEQEAR